MSARDQARPTVAVISGDGRKRLRVAVRWQRRNVRAKLTLTAEGPAAAADPPDLAADLAAFAADPAEAEALLRQLARIASLNAKPTP